jgi:hypothetical protein
VAVTLSPIAASMCVPALDTGPQVHGPGLVYRIAVEAQREFLKLNDVAIGRLQPVRHRQRAR